MAAFNQGTSMEGDTATVLRSLLNQGVNVNAADEDGSS